MADSTKRAEVINIKFEKHPNADSLSLVKIDDYRVCVRTADWKEGQKAAHVLPDTIVNINRPEFSFLKDQAKADGTYRVRIKKLRQVISYGLLVPLPDDFVGNDAWEFLDLKRYEPEENTFEQKNRMSLGFYQFTSDTPVQVCKYDVEAGMKYGTKVFEPGELVHVSEKLHGSSWRAVYKDKMYVGSRSEWKLQYPIKKDVTFEEVLAKIGGEEKALALYSNFQDREPKMNEFWQGLTPEIEEFCTKNPGYIVYGELVGKTQKGYDYGFPNNYKVFCFDIMKPDGQFLNPDQWEMLCDKYNIAKVPIIERAAPFSIELMESFAQGKTLTRGKHIREGCVCKPLYERYDDKCGRVILKFINPEY